MVLRSYKLIDLYSRLKNYIDSNYVTVIIDEDGDITNIGFSGQPERIAILKSDDEQSLLVKISQNISEPLSDKNGKLFEVSSIDELNLVKSGIDVILNMNYSTVFNKENLEATVKEAIKNHSENNSLPQSTYIESQDGTIKHTTPQRTILKFFKKK